MSDQKTGKEVAIRPPLEATGGRQMPIIIHNIEEAFRLGTAIADAGMAPKGFNGPQCTIAIMMGAEVGFLPMQSLQAIAVINGRPTMWGDGVLALVKASGLLEDMEEWTEGDTAFCRVKRKGEKNPATRQFSDADARAAGLLNKDGPWKTYKGRMRQMRARSWALRDVFPDVLRGMYVREEEEDIARATEPLQIAPPVFEDEPEVKGTEGAEVDRTTSATDEIPEFDDATEDAVTEPITVIDGEDEFAGIGEVEINTLFLDELEEAMSNNVTKAEDVDEVWEGLDVEATLTNDQPTLELANKIRARYSEKFQ